MLIFSHCQHLLTGPVDRGGQGMQNQVGWSSAAGMAQLNGNSWLTGENGDYEDPEYLTPTSHHDDPFIQQDKADSNFLI